MDSVNVVADEARATIYGFLAGVFGSHPTPDIVWAVCEMAEALGVACPDYLSMPELDREYMELFVVPNSRYVAPYESVFRDHWLLPATLKPGSNPGEASLKIKGLVMGESTLQVRHCYVQAGVFPGEELPDHIANELRFMAYLWSPEAEALADLRCKFCDEHILKWIGELREKVAENDRLGFYVAAVQVAEAVVYDEL